MKPGRNEIDLSIGEILNAIAPILGAIFMSFLIAYPIVYLLTPSHHNIDKEFLYTAWFLIFGLMAIGYNSDYH